MITITCIKCKRSYTLDSERLKITRDTHDKTLVDKGICPICTEDKV